ncbi:alpha-hydroxy-acid oxidizing protein [Neomesorhizobium albiziae]|uniref:alpha-hydroxy-acid oxidizing protein n=1 Tax=Neomesorhizobium albiziae TaxID=335020 RepID=UPI001AEDAEE5|nr:alpha-hydroxy-acid oxidizing protein [Mesorhizobium albiziae]
MTIINIDLLEEQAQKKLTAFAYAFVSGAAGDEWTMRENRRAFQDFPIMTSRLTGIKKESIDTRTALMGMVLPSPIMVAPMGVHGVVSEQAELATSAGAGAAGVLYQSSGASTKPLEQIAETTNGPKWFQLYFNNDIGVTRSLLQRAAAAKYSAIVLTVDALGPGGSDRVRRLGTSVPRPKFVFGNHDPRFGGSGDFRNQKENLTWDDIAFCQEASGLPVVVKGILRAEDAVQAVKAGAAAVQVSNHGGRQMDGVPSSISVLPGVADALGGKVPIIVDGGVRRGIDVFRALALGADAVAIGRPVLYGLGVGGARGVRSVLDFFNTELKTAMLLAGVEKVDAIGRGNIVMRQFV